MSPVSIVDRPTVAAPEERNSSTPNHANGYSSTPILVDPTAERRPVESITVESPNLVYTDAALLAKYTFHSTQVQREEGGRFTVKPVEKVLQFKTERKVPKTGLMLVGWGGNNGTTLTSTILANKHNISWSTREGVQNPNYYGSLMRASTTRLGVDSEGKDVNVPMCDVLPMVHPNDLVIGGWDISSMSLSSAMRRAKVLEYDLQRQLVPHLENLVPLPSIYYPTFINANQEERADNVLKGSNKAEHLEIIRKDIREFKEQNGLDKVIVLWTANTERYSEITAGVHDTSANLLAAINNSHPEVSPSTIFAVAAILEGCPYINGAPQNTFVPGCIKLAEERQAFIAGDDFKSGQTKIKSVLAEYLVNAGIKPLSIASYNHLGNNDGFNLNAAAQFRSKEISKSSVVDDMVEANPLLYLPLSEKAKAKQIKETGKAKKTEHPDHVIVIKYVPAVGDSKKAIDEYNSEILMGGRNTLNIFNECQDSLLATPLILDLCILAELLTRVTYKEGAQAIANETAEFESLYSILGLLSYMLKAPLVKPGNDVINSLNRQRQALEAFLRACLSLQPTSDLINFTSI